MDLKTVVELILTAAIVALTALPRARVPHTLPAYKPITTLTYVLLQIHRSSV